MGSAVYRSNADQNREKKKKKTAESTKNGRSTKSPSKILQIIEHCMNIADSGCSGQFPLFLFRFCLCGWLMDQEQHKQEYHTFDTTPIWQQTLFVALHRLPQMSSALALLNHNFLFRRHMDGASVWGGLFSVALFWNCNQIASIQKWFTIICVIPGWKQKFAKHNTIHSFVICVCVCFYFIYLLTY